MLVLTRRIGEPIVIDGGICVTVVAIKGDLTPVAKTFATQLAGFPDALAEVSCLKRASCGYSICLDYRIELDDNPESIRSRVEGDMRTVRSGGPSGSRRPGFAVE
jgi:hypothetical protein